MINDDRTNHVLFFRSEMGTEAAASTPLRAMSRAPRHGFHQPGTELTGREHEVLALLCEGLPNKLICRRLAIAPGTVKVHISSVLRKLGASSRLQAVVLAHEQGMFASARAEHSTEAGPRRRSDDAVVLRIA